MKKFILAIAFVALIASSIKAKCLGWQIEEQTDNYTIVRHSHSDECCQTIQLVNNGNIYFLLAMPYGYDQIPLNGFLPRRFPNYYLGKCCWLRRTKRGKKLVMAYGAAEPPDILIGN